MKRRNRIAIVCAVSVIVLAGAGGTFWALRDPEPAPFERLERGLDHFERGEFDAALAEYEAARAGAPDDRRAAYMIAACLASLDRVAEAEQQLTSLLVEAPDHPQGLALAARLASRRGDLDASDRFWTRLKQSVGDAARVDLELAANELRRPTPDLRRALVLMSEARRSGNDAPNLALQEVAIRLRLAGPSGLSALRDDREMATLLNSARRALDLRERESGDDIDLRIARCRLALAEGDTDSALSESEGALAAFPGDAVATAQRADVYEVRAEAWLARGNPEEALIDARLAMQADRSSDRAVAVANLLRQHNRANAALELLDSEAPPADERVAAIRTHLLLDTGANSDARQAIEAARASYGESSTWLILEGLAAEADQEWEEADDRYAAAEHLGASYVATTLRARLALRDGASAASVSGAVESLRSLLKASPSDSAVMATLAQLLLRADGSPDESLELAERATNLAPTSSSAWAVLGQVLIHGPQRGEYALRAARAFERAARLAPGDPTLAANSAAAYLESGEPGQAASACSNALRDAPDDADLREIRARAYRALARWRAASEDLVWLAERSPDDEPILIQAIDSLLRADLKPQALDLARRSRDGASAELKAALAVLVAHVTDPQADVTEAARQFGPSLVVADLLLAQGRTAEALAELREIRRRDGGSAGAAWRLVFALLDGRAPGDAAVSEARAVVDSLRDASGDDEAFALLARGRVEFHDGLYDAAVASLERGLPQVAGRSAPLVVLAAALDRTDDTNRALAVVRRAVTCIDTGPGVRAAAAAVYRSIASSSSPRDRTQVLLEATQVCPEDELAWLALSREFVEGGAFDEAYDASVAGLQVPTLSAEGATELRSRAALTAAATGRIDIANRHAREIAPEGLPPAKRELLRIQILLLGGRTAEAISALEKLVESPDADATAALLLANAFVSQNATEDAVALQESWIASGRDDRALSSLLAIGLARRGEVEVARQVAERALSARPTDAATAEAAAIAIASGGDVDRALQVLDAAEDESGTQVALTRALLAVQTGRELSRSREVAERIFQDLGASLAERGRAALVLGELGLSTGESERAVNEVRSALDAFDSGGFSPSRDLEASLMTVLGTAEAALGKDAEALLHLRRAVTLRPSSVRALNNLAFVMSKVEPGRPAYDVAVRATELSPDDPNVWQTRAAAAEAAGMSETAPADWKTAYRVATSAAGTAPDLRGKIALSLAKSLHAAGEVDAALEHLRRDFLALPPSLAEEAKGLQRAWEAAAE